MCMSASQARVWRSLGKGRIPEKKRMGQGRNVCGLKGGSSFLGGSAKRERDKRRKGDGHGKNKIFNPDG